jgi:hypothetical protein
MSWPQLILGWPTIILAIGAFGFAFTRERSALGFVGVAAAVPFLWYASLAPGGRWLSPIFLVALASTAVLLRHGRRNWAALCFAPFVALVIIMVAAVASQR